MMVESIDRSIPSRLDSDLRGLSITGFRALYSNNFERAEECFRRQLRLVFKAQEQENRPIHKGAYYYNLGIALLGQDKAEEAIHNILLAYVEDTLNVAYDSEDDADRSGAANMLRDILQIRLRILREIKSISAQKKLENIWNEQRDPDHILTEVLVRLNIEGTNLSSFCDRKVKLTWKQPRSFPQPWERRVFIGANYDTFAHIIPEIRDAVERSGYTPVIVADFEISQKEIHHHSIMLLHTCKFAIFELTNPAGQYMEIERLKDYEIAALLLRSARHGDVTQEHWLSAMVETAGYSIVPYTDILHLKEIVATFLKPIFPGRNVGLTKVSSAELEKPVVLDAELIPQTLRRGQTATTRVQFKGRLTNGFFDNEIHFPDGRQGWNWDMGTLADGDADTPGNLNGNVEVTSRWEWTVPKWAPVGEYTVFVRVYNHVGVKERTPVCEQVKKIVVL